MLWFLKAAYAPAFMFGFIGAGLALVTRGQSLAWLAPLLGAAIAVSFFVERVIPYEPIWNRPRGDSRRDGGTMRRAGTLLSQPCAVFG